MTAIVKGGRKKLGKSQTKSSKAGLQFPVGRIARYIRRGRYAKRTGSGNYILFIIKQEHLYI